MAAKVVIAVLAKGHYERCDIRDFILGIYCSGNPLVGRLINATVDQSPTTAARNSVVAKCRSMGFASKDKILMIDHDMVPSMTFFEHAMKFLTDHPGPNVIGSPYCGGPPGMEVQVVERDGLGVVRRVTREEAAERVGTQKTLLVGTGLMLANMAAFDAVKPPIFDYTYDTPAMEVASQTEDFYFCANLAAAGGNAFVAWDHWSMHDKSVVIGKPDRRRLAGDEWKDGVRPDGEEANP